MYAIASFKFDLFHDTRIYIAAFFAIATIVTWIARQMKERTGQSWPVVYGTVESTRLTTVNDKLRAEVHYSYSVAGEYYSGVFFRFPATEKRGEKILERFPRESQILVHYKSEDPDNSVLDLHEVQIRAEQSAMSAPEV